MLSISLHMTIVQVELQGMADRIKSMRSQLFQALKDADAPGDWSHIVNQIGKLGGLFCIYHAAYRLACHRVLHAIRSWLIMHLALSAALTIALPVAGMFSYTGLTKVCPSVITLAISVICCVKMTSCHVIRHTPQSGPDVQ